MKTRSTLLFLFWLGTVTLFAQYPCGRCFDYVTGPNTVTLDFSHVEFAGCPNAEYYVSNYAVGNPGGEQTQTFADLPSTLTYQGGPGEYVFCFGYECEGIATLQGTESQVPVEICCVVVSIGFPCEEPPICHFTIDPDVGFTLEYYTSAFDASSSSDVDDYSWEWGDYSSLITSSPFASHDYSTIFPTIYPEVNLCLVGSNECGMSRYCCTYYTFGEADDYYDWCNLPFSIYSPPEIIPEMEGSTVSFDVSDFACGAAADVFFDAGDGSGDNLMNGCNMISYTYEGEGPYYCCITIQYACISICFCFPFRPDPRFNCEDAYELYCNTYGNEVVQDANDPFFHQGFSPIFDSWERYDYCLGIDDGCDNQNVINTTQTFSAHEVIYKVENPSLDGDQDLVIDLVPLDAGLDVDLFIMESCATYWPGFFTVLEGCAGSSTYPAGIRDAVLIENAISPEYYIVVDGGPGSNDQEGRFELSVTCGDLCTKDVRGFLQCGKTLTDSTTHFTTDNQASYYCGCDNDNGKARAGNYGPENIYILDVIKTDTVVIDLEILTPGRDLELYLLDDCDVESCVRNSRNVPGASERITKLLTPGRYYVVVEGFRGQTGKYRLNVSGCQCAVECPGSNLVFEKNFEGYPAGSQVPGINDSDWDFGNLLVHDPVDQSLVAFIETRENQNKKLILNSTTYNYSDVGLKLKKDTVGIHKVSYDLTLKYTANALSHGVLSFYEYINPIILDAGGMQLRIWFGRNSNGQNFADLYTYKTGFSSGPDSTQLASVTPFINVPAGTQFKTFKVAYVFDLDNGIFSLLVDNTCVYTGLQYFITGSTLLASRWIGFSATRTQSYMEVDNIKYENCGDCEPITVDDCNLIAITDIQSAGDNLAMTFQAPSIDPKTITGWRIVNETTGQTIDLTTGYWPGFIPGHTCRVYVIYRDANGCLHLCCIRIVIPLNCQVIQSDHIGGGNELLFEFSADDPDLEPILFSSLENDVLNVDGIFSYSAPGVFRICALFYHPILKQYILCCRTFCIDYPWSCGPLFTYTVIPGSSENRVIFSRNSPQADTYLWDFGDGNTSTANGTSVTHTYPGGTRKYTVCLTIWDDCRGYCTYCIEIFLGDPLMLYVDDVCGAVGEIVSIPISAVNFENLVTGAFTIKMNGTGAKLVGIENNALTNVFIGTVINDQTAVVNWADVQSNPLTLPDFTVIATVKAQITSASFTSAPVTLASDPVELKFTGIDNSAIPVSTNNGSLCRVTQTSIAGQIHTASSNNPMPMPNVLVWRRGPSDLSVQTDASGRYSVNADIGTTYTISPEKNTGFLNGINPLDLVLVLRHVSFVQRFTDPKQWLAADVDRNGLVEILDYKLINDLLLGRIQSFPGGRSWRFLPANYVFQNPANPLPENAPESLFYQPLQQTVANANFTGIKLGDVNFSASASAQHFHPITSRSACDVFAVPERSITAGEMINVQFQSRNFTDVFTFLLELHLDTTVLEFDSFVSSALPGFTQAQIETSLLQEGYLHTLWVEPQALGMSLADHDNIMTLRFKVLNSGVSLSDALSVTSVHRTSEIIYTTFAANCLEIHFTGIVGVRDVSSPMLQIHAWPNPFSDEVNFEITHDRAEEGRLRIYNTIGQILYDEPVDLSEGTSVLRLQSEELRGTSGILMAQLQTKNTSAVVQLLQVRR